MIAALAAHLERGDELRGITGEQLLQGPLADAMTHVGQLALHQPDLRDPALGGGLAEVVPHRRRDLVLALREELLEALELGLAPAGGARLPRVEHADDKRMMQARTNLNFPKETLHMERGVRAEHFYRHVATVLLVSISSITSARSICCLSSIT